MSMKAYILGKISLGKEQSVIEHVKAKESIKEAYPLMGEYDLIILLEADEEDALRELYDSLELHTIEGLYDQKLLIGIEL